MFTIPPAPSDSTAWDKARAAFAQSPLVDTPLATLAQDLDVPPWPVNSPDESAAAYIYLPYTQVVAALAARGLPPAQLGQLISLLNDTNAFDQPFGDMMDDFAAPAAPGAIDLDSPLHQNLEKLELPDDFPLALSALSSGTIRLFSIEKVDTLGGFVAFASRLSQAVIVGGDFRELLNALAQKDEAGLAKLLPLRPGAPGLHLPESIALAARELNEAARAAVIKTPEAAPPELRAKVSLIISYFARQHANIVSAVAAGSTLAREVSRLHNPVLEPVVAALLRAHLPAPPAPAAAPKKSFLERIFARSS
jgi:hypothetical protein